jgi:hypothetical protein
MTKPKPCQTPRCRNKVKQGRHCSSCRVKRWRAADPVRAAFVNLRTNAKRRGVLFTIQLEDFRDWCVKVDYIGMAGRSSASYTVDRRHNDIGYHLDNIQVLTKRDNVIKFFTYDYRSKAVAFGELTAPTASADDDLPF